MKKAFEVEDTSNRKNYSFVLDGSHVYMYNTSRGSENNLLTTMPEDNADRDYISLFPFGCNTAKEYYDHMYKKSIKLNSGYPIHFIGCVDPETFQSIEAD